MENAGKARSYGLYRHIRTSKEIIKNQFRYYDKNLNSGWYEQDSSNRVKGDETT